jgi:superfamily I DNA/RNA helicase
MEAQVKPTPTEEQQAIIERVSTTNGNLLITALAGTGKTTTLQMMQEHLDETPRLYLAFAKRNVEDAEGKFPSDTEVRTFNSCGHRILAKMIGKRKLEVDKNKSNKLLRIIIDEANKNIQPVLWEVYYDVIAAVAHAKALGYIPDGSYTNATRLMNRDQFHLRLSQDQEAPDELTAELIDAVLLQSIRTSFEGYIDFNDQVFIPAVFGGPYPRFPYVMADEAQDLNPVNHAMLERLVKGRFAAVGDDAQSIYEFRGAVQGGMARLKQKFNMEEMTLSVSFRCPQAVVDHAKWRVPNFKSSKPGGSVDVLSKLDPNTIPDTDDPSGVAFICRNNAPLFKLALQLLAAGRGVSVAGSDIGPRIIGIMGKLGPSNMDRPSVMAAVDDWLLEKIAKKSASAHDIAACMKVFAGYGANLEQAVAYAKSLFEQTGPIKLLTGHKAKGLEWENVYHLDPWLIQDDKGDQERNLRYVITTRAKNHLFEINSAQIQWGEPDVDE